MATLAHGTALRRLRRAAPLAAALLAACAGEPPPPRSGFLAEYDVLSAASAREAASWVDPAASFAPYRSVLLDSVTVWGGARMGRVARPEQQALADRLYAALHHALAKEFGIAPAPGPGTLRVRAALASAEPGSRVFEAVGTELSVARAATAPGRLSSAGADAARAAGCEVEITDSLSNRRLLVAVDPGIAAGARSWDDLERAHARWARGLAERLAALRQDGAAH